MVILEDAEGFHFYWPEQIAAITPEFGGRFRVVARDGVCATCGGGGSALVGGQRVLRPGFCRPGELVLIAFVDFDGGWLDRGR
jgi:hypothetical protein